jgi:plasmid stabilization system protein ParE
MILREVLAYIDRQGPERGAKFRAELRRCLEQIKASPDGWPRAFRNVRIRIMRIFKFGLYYQTFEDKDLILIGAVVHLKRRGEILEKAI